MSSLKNIKKVSLMVKKEVTYGTPIALTAATDGITLADIPTHDESYLFDGKRMGQQEGLNAMQDLPKNGRLMDLGNILCEAKGAGAAYSASNKTNVTPFLVASGMDETLTVTPGTEKQEFVPTGPATAMSSLTAELYDQGEKLPLAGMYFDHVLRLKNGGPALWEINGRGMVSAEPSDAANPAITYPHSNLLPPVCNNIGFNIGSFLLGKILELEFKAGRVFNAEDRPDLNATSGVAGLMWGGWDPVLRMVIESTALVGSPYHTVGGIDPYRLNKDAVNVACDFTIGATQYNKLTVAFPNGLYFRTVKKARGTSVARWEIEAAPRGVTPLDMGWLKYTFD
jgi:hypothetical protein